MSTAKKRRSAQNTDVTNRSQIENPPTPSLEVAFSPTTSLATTLAMLHTLPDPREIHVVPKASYKGQTWMLHPTVEQLLFKYRDALITRFHPTASSDEAEAETAYIFNQIAPLLQRVPPFNPKKPRTDDMEDFNKQSVQRKFADIILSLIENFVNESGDQFLKPPHRDSAAYQVDYWKRAAIKQVLANEIAYNKEKNMVAIYDAWERETQEDADDLQSQRRQFIQKKTDMEEELKKLAARCGYLEKLSNKSVEDQVRIKVKDVTAAHAVVEKKCKKFALVNRDLSKQSMFLAARGDQLDKVLQQTESDRKELVAKCNTLGRDCQRLVGINQFLYDRLLHAQDIQEGMVNEECKKELTRLKDEMSELTEQMKKFSGGDEVAVALDQYIFIHEKYEAEKQGWELEKKIWSDMNNMAVTKLKSNEEFFENIRTAFANKKAEREGKVVKQPGTKKEGSGSENKGENATKRDTSFDGVAHTLFNDDPSTRRVIAKLEESSKPTPKEANLQRIIASLQNQLSISRRAWKIEAGQQIESHKKLVAENTRLAQELAIEKKAKKILEAEKSELNIDGGNFDGTLVWVSDTYEQAEKKLKEELEEEKAFNGTLRAVIEAMQNPAMGLPEMLEEVMAKAGSMSLEDAKNSESLMNGILDAVVAQALVANMRSKQDEGSLKDTGEVTNDENSTVEVSSVDRAVTETMNCLSDHQAVSEVGEKEHVENGGVRESSDDRVLCEVGEKEHVENGGVVESSDDRVMFEVRDKKKNIETDKRSVMSATGTVKSKGEKRGGRISMMFDALRTKVSRH